MWISSVPKTEILKIRFLSNIFLVFIFLLISQLFWASKLDMLNIWIKIAGRAVEMERFNYLNGLLVNIG